MKLAIKYKMLNLFSIKKIDNNLNSMIYNNI